MPGAQDRSSSDNAESTRKQEDEQSNLALKSNIGGNPERAKHWAKIYRTSIASGVSSVAAIVVGYPLDSVKTRLQGYDTHATATLAFQDTYKKEGLYGFWRGLAAPIFSYILVRTLGFEIYQKAKYQYSAAIGKATGGDEPLVAVNRPGSVPTPATVACFAAAGATSGCLASVVACPFDLAKSAAQMSQMMADSKITKTSDPIYNQIKDSYLNKGTLKTMKNIVHHHGLLGLYSGYGLHLVKDTFGSAIYFSTYESTKQILVKLQGSDSPTAPSSVAIAGGFSGLASWLCLYPIDLAKTHYQRMCLTTPKGGKVTMPKIDYFKRGSWRALGISMGRSCVSNAVFFSSFEYIKKQINQLPDPVLDEVD